MRALCEQVLGLPAPRAQPYAHLLLGHVAHGSGRAGQAWHELRDALASFERVGDVPTLRQAVGAAEELLGDRRMWAADDTDALVHAARQLVDRLRTDRA